MKKSLLTLGLIFSVGVTVSAQDCSELFISEYLEGYSNNKALEIYNPTNETVDLSNYFVVRYSNGNSNPTVQSAVQLRGDLAPKAVHVGVIDKRNQDGEGQEAPIWDDLSEKADEFYSPVYDENNTFYWNGNDAVVLFKGTIPPGTPLAAPVSSLSGIQPIDIFGVIGDNPGEPSQGGGWTLDGTPAVNGGEVVSADHFLVRKTEIKKGNNQNNSLPYAIGDDWEVLPFLIFILTEEGDTVFNNQGNPAQRMNVDNLGIHECECGNTVPASIVENDINNFGFEVFPNPATNKQINFLSTSAVKEIVITDALGKMVTNIQNAKPTMSIDLNVRPGLYFISAKGNGGVRMTKKIIVK